MAAATSAGPANQLTGEHSRKARAVQAGRPARPAASAFGRDAYPGLDAKAAALLHSLARNHALVDGNTRLALAGVIAFYGLNGYRLTLTNDEAYELVMAVADGHLDDVGVIAARLGQATAPRS